MKSHKTRIFTFFFVLPVVCFAQNKTYYTSIYPDTLVKSRLKTVIIAQSLAYTTSMVGLYSLWYKNYPQSSFHFFNDNKEWLKMDKLGHTITNYNLSRLSYASFRFAGVSKKKAAIYGSLAGFTYMTVIEILDGFSSQWGASPGDLIANTLGNGFFLGQQLAWGEQRILFKYSFHQSKYAKYRPDLLGENFLQQSIKDYNGQSMWASANISAFLPKDYRFPKWLNIAFGYGADGMVGTEDNPPNHNGKPLPYLERYSQYYLSFDIDLTRIPVKSKFLHIVFHALSFMKFPLPTLEYNKPQGLKFHPLYF